MFRDMSTSFGVVAKRITSNENRMSSETYELWRGDLWKRQREREREKESADYQCVLFTFEYHTDRSLGVHMMK
jgi:hypothetical protein